MTMLAFVAALKIRSFFFLYLFSMDAIVCVVAGGHGF